MLTREIPPEAMPVVEILRRDVPRPEELPGDKWPSLSWPSPYWRRCSRLGVCCPMGLHPKSLFNAPNDASVFADGETTDDAVDSFGKWWDEQTDPQAAVDSIWGKET